MGKECQVGFLGCQVLEVEGFCVDEVIDQVVMNEY